MQTEHLSVSGMSCGGCTNKVTRALKAVAGVGDEKCRLRRVKPQCSTTSEPPRQVSSEPPWKARATV